MFRAAQLRRGLLPSSVTRREADLRKLDRWLGERSLIEATRADVEGFLDTRRWDAKTVAAFLSHLHAFYGWARKQGLTSVDPTLDIDRPKLRTYLPRPIGDEDLAYLLGQADAVMRAWLTLGAFAGLRCAEIAGLRREDVIEGRAYLHVRGKGNKERIVPAHPLVLEALRALPMPRKGLIFRRPDGGPYTPAQVSQRGARWMRDAGVDVTMHQLRHWFGTSTWRQCHDPLAVAALLGHADISNVAVYAQFDNAVATAAVHSLTL